MMTKAKDNPRRRNGHRRNQLRDKVARMGLPCALCGRPIDYTLPPGHPWCYELDEIIPVSKGGNPLDPANVQPAHRRCNQLKGNGTRRRRDVEHAAQGVTSVRW